jgi:hypothetical protein
MSISRSDKIKVHLLKNHPMLNFMNDISDLKDIEFYETLNDKNLKFFEQIIKQK